MRNFIQKGEAVPVIAPAAVASGDGLLVGKLFGVAAYQAAAGAEVEIRTQGVFDLTAEGAASGQAFAVGAIVYWDNPNKRVTATAAGNTRVGTAVAAKATTAALARVLLPGVVP